MKRTHCVWGTYWLRMTAYALRMAAYEFRMTAYALRMDAYELRMVAYALRTPNVFGTYCSHAQRTAQTFLAHFPRTSTARQALGFQCYFFICFQHLFIY